MTQVIDITSDEWLDAALAALREGKLVAFPTDTVYGVGADPLQPGAVRDLFRVKGRPSDKPIPLLVAHACQIEKVAREVSSNARRLAHCFWPGPVSLVLPAREEIPSEVTARGDTVALRMPDHPVALELIGAFGRPLAVTSANRSGEPSPVTAEQVVAQLGGRIALVLDGGACPGGRPSTVLTLVTEPPQLLRTGPVAWDEIARCLDPL